MGARFLSADRMKCKVFQKGSDKIESEVGIFAAEHHVDKVVNVRRVSDRVIILKVK